MKLIISDVASGPNTYFIKVYNESGVLLDTFNTGARITGLTFTGEDLLSFEGYTLNIHDGVSSTIKKKISLSSENDIPIGSIMHDGKNLYSAAILPTNTKGNPLIYAHKGISNVKTARFSMQNLEIYDISYDRVSGNLITLQRSAANTIINLHSGFSATILSFITLTLPGVVGRGVYYDGKNLYVGYSNTINIYKGFSTTLLKTIVLAGSPAVWSLTTDLDVQSLIMRFNKLRFV